MRDMSGSGPFGPNLNGVWQSLHSIVRARYSPLAMVGATAADGGCAGGVALANILAPRTSASTAKVCVMCDLMSITLATPGAAET
jgi:hypothetical protein